MKSNRNLSSVTNVRDVYPSSAVGQIRITEPEYRKLKLLRNRRGLAMFKRLTNARMPWPHQGYVTIGLPQFETQVLASHIIEGESLDQAATRLISQLLAPR